MRQECSMKTVVGKGNFYGSLRVIRPILSVPDAAGFTAASGTNSHTHGRAVRPAAACPPRVEDEGLRHGVGTVSGSPLQRSRNETIRMSFDCPHGAVPGG